MLLLLVIEICAQDIPKYERKALEVKTETAKPDSALSNIKRMQLEIIQKMHIDTIK